MRFHRSISYQPTPLSLEVTDREIQGRRQSTAWTCRTLAEMGVPCSVPKPQEIVADSSAPEVDSELAQVRSVICPSNLLKEVGEMHQVNMQRSLTRRIQVARERGDKTLLQVLEAELRQTVALQ